MIRKYTILDQYEECECYQCGTPLDVGDKAYTMDNCVTVYCSRLCLKADCADWLGLVANPEEA